MRKFTKYPKQSVEASSGYSAERTQLPFNVFEKTIGEYAAERSVSEEEAQEWFEKLGEPVTHVFEAWNSPFVGLRGESGDYYFSESFEASYPVKMEKLTRQEMLDRLKGSVGHFGDIDDEPLEDSPPDYFVKGSASSIDLGRYEEFYTLPTVEEIDAAGYDSEYCETSPDALDNYDMFRFVGWAMAKEEYIDILDDQNWGLLCLCQDVDDSYVLVQCVGDRCYTIGIEDIQHVILSS